MAFAGGSRDFGVCPCGLRAPATAWGRTAARAFHGPPAWLHLAVLADRQPVHPGGIYQFPNSGILYDLGFIIGITLLYGSVRRTYMYTAWLWKD